MVVISLLISDTPVQETTKIVIVSLDSQPYSLIATAIKVVVDCGATIESKIKSGSQYIFKISWEEVLRVTLSPAQMVVLIEG